MSETLLIMERATYAAEVRRAAESFNLPNESIGQWLRVIAQGDRQVSTVDLKALVDLEDQIIKLFRQGATREDSPKRTQVHELLRQRDAVMVRLLPPHLLGQISGSEK